MKKITFLLFPTLLYACDPIQTQIQAVKNSSKNSLVIYHFFDTKSDTIILPPTDSKDIIVFDGLGDTPEQSCATLRFSDSMYITTPTKKKL